MRQTQGMAGLVAALVLAGASVLSPDVRAQGEYPIRIVTIIVPLPAGGIVDAAARKFATEFSKRLGRQFIVENKVGAGGLIGLRALKTAAPDGHTLLWNSYGVAMPQALQKQAEIDVRRDMVLVSTALQGYLGIWVNAALPVKSMKEFIDYARLNPGKLNYGSTGVGGATHIPTAAILNRAGINLVHVPYAGGAQTPAALMAGDIHMLLQDIAYFANTGKDRVRLLAVVAKERSPLFPDSPTLAETGINYTTAFWLGLFAPADTPQPVLVRLNALVRESLDSGEIRDYLKSQSWSPMWNSLDASKQLINSEVAQWMDTVRTAGIPMTD